MRRQYGLSAIIACVALLCAITAVSAYGADSKPTPESFVGNKIPDTLLKDLTGKPGRIYGRTGKVVLVEFWATWCPDCREVAPHVQALHDRYGKSGLDVVAVSVDTRAETVVKFMGKNKYSFPVLMASTDTRTIFRVLRIPTVYIIDKQGIVRAVYVEYGEKGAPAVEAKVKELLGK